MKSSVVLFLIAVLLSCPAAFSKNVVECEHPLQQKIYQTIPLFRPDYSEDAVLKMYRGVRAPQFDEGTLLRYMFHDPYTYSSGLLVENGDGRTVKISKGAWGRKEEVDLSKKDESFVQKKISDALERWDSVLQETGTIVRNTDGLRRVWDQFSYGTYNDTYYNWVQFASIDIAQAAGYSINGNYIFELDLPLARVNPQFAGNASIIPVLIAPWEASGVRASGSVTIEKIFQGSNESLSPDANKVNRCEVENLKITKNKNTIAYLTLCDEDSVCTKNLNLIKDQVSETLYNAIQNFKLDGAVISVTASPEASNVKMCHVKNFFNTTSALQEALSPLSEARQESKLKKYLMTLSLEKPVKCDAEIRKTVAYWSQLPNLSWRQALLLGLQLKEGRLLLQAIETLANDESPYQSFEEQLDSFALLETNFTRKKFLKSIVGSVSILPESKASKAFLRIKNYLVK